MLWGTDQHSVFVQSVVRCLSGIVLWAAQMHKSTNAQMHKCTNTQMHNCTNAQMHKCTNAQMHKCKWVTSKEGCHTSASNPALGKQIQLEKDTPNAGGSFIQYQRKLCSNGQMPIRDCQWSQRQQENLFLSQSQKTQADFEVESFHPASLRKRLYRLPLGS